MTLTKALKLARGRVYLMAWANRQWSVDEWSPRHNATIQGRITDIYHARNDAKETRIRVALELLEVEDADAIANGLAQEQGAWDDLLRYWYRKHGG